MTKQEQKSQLIAASELIQSVLDARQEEFDDHSDDWQESEKGQEHQEATDSLEAIQGDLDMWVDSL